MCVCVCVCVQSCPTLAIPGIIDYQAPLSMEFSNQEYWNELSFLSPGDLPNPGIEPESLASPALKVDALPMSPLGSPLSR